MTTSYPRDALNPNVMKALKSLGFKQVDEKSQISSIFQEENDNKITFILKLKKSPKNHVSMVRENKDHSKTLMTIPDHIIIKASTLRFICLQSGISRGNFLKAYDKT